MFGIYICDSNKIQRKKIRKIIEKYENNYPVSIKIFEVESTDSLKELAQNRIDYMDLIILNPCMSEVNGVTVMQKLIERGWKSQVIFVSESADALLESFQVHPVDYIYGREPVEEKLMLAVTKALTRCQKATQKVLKIKKKGVIKYIPHRNVEYIFSDKREINIIHSGGEQDVCYGKISEIDELGEKIFLRTNRSYIANMMYATKYTETELHMEDGGILPISERFVNPVKRIIDLHLIYQEPKKIRHSK